MSTTTATGLVLAALLLSLSVPATSAEDSAGGGKIIILVEGPIASQVNPILNGVNDTLAWLVEEIHDSDIFEYVCPNLNAWWNPGESPFQPTSNGVLVALPIITDPNQLRTGAPAASVEVSPEGNAECSM